MTHICYGNLTIIGPYNGLSPDRRQAIIRTNAGVLLIEPLRTNFGEISIEIHTFSFKEMHLKMSSGKWRPFCLGLNVLNAVSIHDHILDVFHAYGCIQRNIKPVWPDRNQFYIIILRLRSYLPGVLNTNIGNSITRKNSVKFRIGEERENEILHRKNSAKSKLVAEREMYFYIGRLIIVFILFAHNSVRFYHYDRISIPFQYWSFACHIPKFIVFKHECLIIFCPPLLLHCIHFALICCIPDYWLL